jgi:prepilin-type processing-associated H-X9-DG protein
MAISKITGSGLGAITQDGAATFNEGSADVDFRVESNGNANMLFVDGGNDAVVIGHNNANDGSVSSAFALQNIGTSYNSSSIGLARFSADVNAPSVVFHKSRNASIGGDTIVADNDELGRIRFFGNDGTDFAEGARITAIVNGTPGGGDMPTELVFSTSADGAESPTARMSISSGGDIDVETGDIFFSTAGKGIVLGATSNTAANTLDDYEEGTWTPVITTSGAPNTAFTQYNDGSFYTKVGNTVFLSGMFRTNGVTIAGASGNVVVNGLPFAATSSVSGGININQSDGWTASPHAGYTTSSKIQLTYQLLSSSQNIISLPYTALATGSGLKNLIHIFGTYRTDS